MLALKGQMGIVLPAVIILNGFLEFLQINFY